MHDHTYMHKIRIEEGMNFRGNMESIEGAKSEISLYEILSSNNKKEPCKKKEKNTSFGQSEAHHSKGICMEALDWGYPWLNSVSKLHMPKL